MSDAVHSHLDATSRSHGGPLAASQTKARRRALPSISITGLVLLLITVLAGIDVLRFSDYVTNLAPASTVKADGIVALTGGAARIDGALALLAEGRGERLLISGVNPAVGRRDIARAVQRTFRSAFDRTVDLGHVARDTIGNADEAKAWAQKHDFHSLIIVTSNYHMPRSMVELAGAMPGMTLIPYPIANSTLDMKRWWRQTASTKLFLAEYLKYTLARIRLVVESPFKAAGIGEVHAAAGEESGLTPFLDAEAGSSAC